MVQGEMAGRLPVLVWLSGRRRPESSLFYENGPSTGPRDDAPPSLSTPELDVPHLGRFLPALFPGATIPQLEALMTEVDRRGERAANGVKL
jgi:hypothetical protein